MRWQPLFVLYCLRDLWYMRCFDKGGFVLAKILILTTGGTIASVQSPDGLVPGMNSDQLRNHLPRLAADIDIDIKELFHIDSTDMSADHWKIIIDAIRSNYSDYDGFVLCHGTDTMAYTAAVLSYAIQDSDKPIVLTGAQKPIGFEITDAKSNIHDSIIYAADPASRGVQIVFAGKVIAGTRARKVRSMSFSAFASLNLPEIAEINNDRIIRYLTDESYYSEGRQEVDGSETTEREHGSGAVEPEPAKATQSSVRFYDGINPSVFMLKLTPGMSPDLIPEIFRIYDAVVIESFGAGGIPDYLEPTLSEVLSKYRPEEKVVAMATQVPYEGSHLETYEVGRRISGSFSILETHDMTHEAAVAKLMWILAEDDRSWDDICRRFYEPVALDRLVV